MNPISAFLDAIADWAVSLMSTIGGPGAGLAIAVENLFPPIPSEVILPLAGFTASRGELGLIEVLIWTTVGSVVGALVLYGLGAWLGANRLRRIADRLPLMTGRDVDRASEWFVRHGSKAVFFGRMIPIYRSLISIPAGVTRMSPLRFIALTTAGSAVWNSAFVCAGYALGENWGRIEPFADVLQYAVITASVTAVAAFVILRLRRNSRAKMAE